MKLQLLHESKNDKNILLLVHPHYAVEKRNHAKYYPKFISEIRSKLSKGWIVIVTYMPLWGSPEAGEALGHNFEDSEASQIGRKFMEEVRSFKTNPNFYFVDDTAVFGTDTIKNKTGLCSDSRIIDIILGSENITVKIGGGYASSCVANTLETFGGEDFLNELGIKVVYDNDLLFDY